ncbi:hypothetical protein K435DRAFT_654794 [Dendrothele bispora CBS 962.96]|uniref:DUF4218 domain-containing protein n=1 Tax=Dendrothele bispora (strain CBS 962.96) TaxID=1314807 RepID=A0A4S8MG96_DENBC|nr:hypothetical protein K435DRAFT_654794 [Dendrothele bispora CBS 962.96]
MFLCGIIPGPKEPSFHEINYILKVLVDDLKVLWQQGIFLNKTHQHPTGRSVRGALGPLVCDLPAARLVAGFAPHSASEFACSLCVHEDRNNIDPSSFHPRDPEKHRKVAQAWLAAKTSDERDEIFKRTGIRWSELLNLPYWNPVHFTVIDSMHCFYLRILRCHCRDIWRMGVEEPTEDDKDQGHRALRYGSLTALEKLPKGVLRYLALHMNEEHRGSKKSLLATLIRVRAKNGWPLSPISSMPEDNFPTSQDNVPTPFTASQDIGHKENAFKSLSTEEQKNSLAHAQKQYKHGRGTKKELLFYSPDVIRQLAASEGILLTEGSSKKALRCLLGITDEDNKVIKGSKKSRKNTAVLGKQRLSEVREDMSKLRLPSWMSQAPSRPGDTAHGKFSADQWRAFCTINLPITLIRLWALEPKDSREFQMLTNFMHLVTAVRLANMRTITQDRIDMFEEHMHMYLEGVRRLFPERNITPYQHMSMHFGSMLKRFGPVHSWRCFPFERYNYLLQNIPTNSRMGDIEKTVFTKFCKTQKLKSLLNETNLPSSLKPLAMLFDEIFNSDIRGTRTGDALAFDAYLQETEEVIWDWQNTESAYIEKSILQQVNTWAKPNARLLSVIDRNSVKRLDVSFSTELVTFSDAQVVFKDMDKLCGWSAGSIIRIFSVLWRLPTGQEASKTFAVIKKYKDLSLADAQLDPYRQFGFAGGRLFYEEKQLDSMLIPVNLITAHFAYTPVPIANIRRKTIHVLPQNKASDVLTFIACFSDSPPTGLRVLRMKKRVQLG